MFQTGAFQSNAFQQGTGAPGHVRHGGDDAWKKKRIEDIRPQKFGDIERRMRLRVSIEEQIAEPRVQVAIAPYMRPGRHQPKVNWAQIYENIEQLEKIIAAVQRARQEEIDDEDDFLSLF